MPTSDQSTQNGNAKHTPSPEASTAPPSRSFFAVPRPVKRLFDAFPLKTYEANELPGSAQKLWAAEGHALFIWSSDADVRERRVSFNPACLKWQVYLKTRNVKFHTISSSNHASTSERLPFLMVNQKYPSPFESKDMVSAHELARWAAEEKDSWPKELELQYEAYMSLLNNEVRRAWLYHMYLTPNFHEFTVPLYIGTHTSAWLIRFLSGYELRKAARDNLLKFSPKLDVEGVYNGAQRAFHALDNVMRRKMKINSKFGKPSLLESTLFAYLFLLLEMPKERWQDDRLPSIVRKFPTLVQICADWKRELAFKPPRLYDSSL